MKITGISGSPRPESSTNALIKAVLDSTDGESQIFNINELDIKPCQSCYYCKENGVCKYQDDYTDIVKALDESDVFVIGSPIYFSEVTAQLKTFIDRLYSVVNNQGISTKLVLIYVQANPDGSLYKPYIEAQSNMLSNIGFELVDTINAYGIPEYENLIENKEFLEKAKEIGSKL